MVDAAPVGVTLSAMRRLAICLSLAVLVAGVLIAAARAEPPTTTIGLHHVAHAAHHVTYRLQFRHLICVIRTVTHHHHHYFHVAGLCRHWTHKPVVP